MKSKILIIEDNYHKFFTTKQVLETQLNMTVNVVGVKTSYDLVKAASDLKPDVVMCCPKGGVIDLLDKMKKRKTNRRNTEITLLVTHALNDDLALKVQQLMDASSRRPAEAA